MKKIIAISSLLIMLWSCSKHHHDDPIPEPEPQHTVLVYMAGENSLSDVLSDDIAEMAQGSLLLNENQHLIAFVDSIGSAVKPYIAEFSGGTWRKVYQYDSDFSSADPDRLREAILWTANNYPSEDYGLVLWGHASGWVVANDTIAKSRAYGQDKGSDTDGRTRWMNITQMARALEGTPHLKFIFSDCCDFMCIESAYELRHAADYLIGSPAEIPDEGAPYDELVPILFSESETFYREIIDCYYNFYLQFFQKPTKSYLGLSGYSLPLSAVDLTKMDEFASATRAVVSTFAPTYPDELSLDGVPYYFGYESDKVMFDMKGIIYKKAGSSAYAEWEKAFAKAVPYYRMSMKWLTIYNSLKSGFMTFDPDEGQYGCVSLFVPQKAYRNSYFDYNVRIRNFQWYNVLRWSDYGW